MGDFNLVRSGLRQAASLIQSTVDVLDSFLTNGVLDRILVHLRLSLFSKESGIMKDWKSWLLATRPKTLIASVVPVAVGTCLAFASGATISLWVSFFALLSAFGIQIGTNLINDALDFKKGADTAERLGPVRVTQSGLLTMQQVHLAGLICFAAAVIFAIPLILRGGWPIAILMVLSVISGYAYTGGPKPLAYCGIGDVFVLLFYGFASTVAVFFLQSGHIDSTAFFAGAQIGLLAMVILAVNNLRDHVQDAMANKRTLAVRFGTTFARIEITLCTLLPFVLNWAWWPLGYHQAALLPLAALPIAFQLLSSIWKTPPGREYNAFLAKSAFLQMAFGLLLSIAFLNS